MYDEEEPSHNQVEPPRQEEKKHVTVNDQPEVFTIRQDTLAVVKEERPTPLLTTQLSVEDLPEKVLADIADQTTDIISFCEDVIMNQKMNSAKLGFMLIRIADSLKEYDNCITLLNKFLLNGDEVTAQYFISVCKYLPPYGDYLRTLDDIADPSMAVKGIEGPVNKTDLQQMVKDIRDNAYAGGMFLESFRVMTKNVNNHMRKRREITEHISKQIGTWLNLKNSVVEHLDKLREILYKLSANLDFLKSGESRIKPAPYIDSMSYNEDSSNSSGNSSSGNWYVPVIGDRSMSSGNGTLNSMFDRRNIPSSSSSSRPMFHDTTTCSRNGSFNPLPSENRSFVSGDSFSAAKVKNKKKL